MKNLTEILIFGKQPVLHALHTAPERITEILFAKKIEKNLFCKFSALQKPIKILDERRAQALSRGQNHQGFFAKILLDETPFSAMKNFCKIIFLCGLQDVGNIGAIVRSAYIFGADGVIFGGNVNLSGIFRTSVGALLNLPFCVVENTLDAIHELKMAGILCVGADMSGETLEKSRQILKNRKISLFFGAENSGLQKKIRVKMDIITKIHMARAGETLDSLNVSVSAGILMHDLLKVEDGIK